MKENHNAKPGGVLKSLPLRFGLVALMMGTGFALSTPASAATPIAGTLISNQASADYTDGSGQSQTATSNTVQTLVQQVGSFTLVNDNIKTAAAGNTVYMPHVLTNTGNGSDAFKLSYNELAGTFALGTPVFYLDANQDGIPDNNTPLNLNNPVTLAPGETFSFVVALAVPGGVADALQDKIEVVATAQTPALYDGDGDGTFGEVGVDEVKKNTDTVNSTTGPAFTLTKNIDIPSGPAPSTGLVTYTLTYKNNGLTAGNLALRDVIGQAVSTAGFSYEANSAVWSANSTPLTDAYTVGTPDATVSGSEIHYQAVTVAGVTTINATITNVPANATGTITFKVNVLATAAIGTSTTTNQALFGVDTDNDPTNNAPGTELPSNSNQSPYEVIAGRGVIANNTTANATDGAAATYPTGFANTQTPATQADLVFPDGKTTLATNIAAPGEVLLFQNVIHNTGNAIDTFNIAQADLTNNWPAGTAFQLLKADGATTLVDTNADNIPDTGPVAAGGYYTVVVKVTLPASISPIPTGPFDLKVTATSVAVPSLFNDVIDRLMTISNLKLQLTPDNSGQISPGGTVVYAHTLTNTGNTQCTDTMTFNVTPNPAAAGWSYTLYKDVDGNGVIDATDTVIPMAAAYDLGIVGNIFAVNAEFKLLLKVFAPANATPPTVDIAKIVANGTCNGTATASSPVVDTTTVIIGQVRLVKTQTLDKDCDGDTTADPAFTATQITAKPGECIRYKIEATNEGLGKVTSLVIKDTTPAYTGFDVMPTCMINGAAGGTPGASPAGVKWTATANGTQNVLESCTIGDLNSGIKAEMNMSVQVNKF